MLISVEAGVKNRLELGQEYGGCSSVVTLFFANILTKTDRCAGTLS